MKLISYTYLRLMLLDSSDMNENQNNYNEWKVKVIYIGIPKSIVIFTDFKCERYSLGIAITAA